ncbi:MAG TPA: hypothetical protein VHX62_05415 [Solirubrobacteraceae bacterium]|jgi:hypothetical protein|nr:hypothetical protein [Solirubrobacteraceae bacterium]
MGYLEPYRVVCELCGQLVPGRYWLDTIASRDRIFCSPDHAARYETYWLPLYGSAESR